MPVLTVFLFLVACGLSFGAGLAYKEFIYPDHVSQRRLELLNSVWLRGVCAAVCAVGAITSVFAA